MTVARLAILGVFIGGIVSSCAPSGTAPAAPPSQDAAFQQLADEFLADYFKRNPTNATYLGIHDYDSQLEDASKAAIEAEVATLKEFRARFAAIAAARRIIPRSISSAFPRPTSRTRAKGPGG